MCRHLPSMKSNLFSVNCIAWINKHCPHTYDIVFLLLVIIIVLEYNGQRVAIYAIWTALYTKFMRRLIAEINRPLLWNSIHRWLCIFVILCFRFHFMQTGTWSVYLPRSFSISYALYVRAHLCMFYTRDDWRCSRAAFGVQFQLSKVMQCKVVSTVLTVSFPCKCAQVFQIMSRWNCVNYCCYYY